MYSLTLFQTCSVIHKIFQPSEAYRCPFVWLILKGRGLGSATDTTHTRYFHTWLWRAAQRFILLHLNLGIIYGANHLQHKYLLIFPESTQYFLQISHFWHREWVICSEIRNYSNVQNKIWDWATELKKIQSVKKPPLLCCEHGMKVTDVCSPETILSAPFPALCLQRSALLLHPSAYIKLTSCWSLKLMEM